MHNLGLLVRSGSIKIHDHHPRDFDNFVNIVQDTSYQSGSILCRSCDTVCSYDLYLKTACELKLFIYIRIVCKEQKSYLPTSPGSIKNVYILKRFFIIFILILIPLAIGTIYVVRSPICTYVHTLFAFM